MGPEHIRKTVQAEFGAGPINISKINNKRKAAKQIRGRIEANTKFPLHIRNIFSAKLEHCQWKCLSFQFESTHVQSISMLRFVEIQQGERICNQLKLPFNDVHCLSSRIFWLRSTKKKGPRQLLPDHVPFSGGSNSHGERFQVLIEPGIEYHFHDAHQEFLRQYNLPLVPFNIHISDS